MTKNEQLVSKVEPQTLLNSVALHYDLVAMKKEHVARRIAKESHMTASAAADQVDRILNNLARRVRKGQSASLPGLGTFRSGRDQDFQFDGSQPHVDERVKSKKGRP